MAEQNDELDERKQQILKAVIDTYLATGEPVGSRTISKYTDLKLSSATIRNEMADLEDMGYVMAPHTSAGRIPTDKGYRFYVDKMMEIMKQNNDEIEKKQKDLDKREKELDDMKELINSKVDKMDDLLKNVAKLLAKDTNYASMISTPSVKSSKLKFIQLTYLGSGKILLVIVMDGNLIRSKVVEVSGEITQEQVLKLNLLLNTTLNGLTLEQMNLALMSGLESKAGQEHGQIIREVMQALIETIQNADNLQIYISGATNIFKYPELSDSSTASELISTLEDKQGLTSLIKSDRDSDEEDGITVYIGDETPVETMKDCSVVTATYELQDGMKGTIGIIGPRRMDYEKVVETLRTIRTQLDDMFNKS
ncbi:MAG: heat-inducible transcriptional repressor HrcA [Lachnospiraceae bacterium]|jgi:heat-inducible transcriptional repressor